MFVHKPILLAINRTKPNQTKSSNWILNRIEAIWSKRNRTERHTVKSAFDNNNNQLYSRLAKSNHDSITLSSFTLAICCCCCYCCGCALFSLLCTQCNFHIFTVFLYGRSIFDEWIMSSTNCERMRSPNVNCIKKFAWIIIIGICVECNAHSYEFQFE